MSARKCMDKCILSAMLALLLAGCATGAMVQTPAASSRTSRLADPNEVKALLVRIVDVEKLVPGIMVGMIAADPKESWLVGYGSLSATDENVPDGDTVYDIGSITKFER